VHSKHLNITLYYLVYMKGEKRERIISVLLDTPNGSLTAYRIHKQAECSEQWVGSYLKKLESMNLVKKTKVTDIYGLFEHWLNIRPPLEFAGYHLQKDPLTIIKNANLTYALTTYQADNLVHRYLFPTRTDVYILKDELEKWHNTLLSHGLVGAGNTRIIIEDPHLFKNCMKQKGYNIVSKPQLICDLFMEGGVAVDAANLLIKKWYAGFI
jgi:predicted transcriptional regulator